MLNYLLNIFFFSNKQENEIIPKIVKLLPNERLSAILLFLRSETFLVDFKLGLPLVGVLFSYLLRSSKK